MRYIYIYIYIHIHKHIYIYIERERDVGCVVYTHITCKRTHAHEEHYKKTGFFGAITGAFGDKKTMRAPPKESKQHK